MADCAARTIAVVVSMARVTLVVLWLTLPVRTDPAGGGTVGGGSLALAAEAPAGAPCVLEAAAPPACADSPPALDPADAGALTCVPPGSGADTEGVGGLT